VLADPRAISEFTVDMIESFARTAPTPTPPTFDLSRVQVYREADLTTELRRAADAARHVALLRIALQADHPAADRTQELLLSEASIRQAFDRLTGENS
jgi:hypothetical protein